MPTTVHAAIENLPYTVTLLGGEHQWLADEPADLGGANAGPTPGQLLLSSLGACTAITLKMYANRKEWSLEKVDIELILNPDGKPTSGTDIQRRLTLHGALDDDQKERLLQIANACPIHKLLSGDVRIHSALAD